MLMLGAISYFQERFIIMRVSKERVIEVASEIADTEGLNKLSLKVVAEKLNIRTPSLYNHILSLEELLREVAHNGMRSMNEQMTQSAIGYTGDAAIKSVGIAYLEYVTKHPGVYEVIQWVHWHENDDTKMIFDAYKALLVKLILSCGWQQKYKDEALKLLMGVIHGYVTLELGRALSNYDQVKKEFSEAIEVVLSGLHNKYDNKS